MSGVKICKVQFYSRLKVKIMSEIKTYMSERQTYIVINLNDDEMCAM